MPDMQEIVIDVVALSGGRLVGRTRLQKTVYLLDALGMNSGAFFYYHNFGPFSDDVADAVSDSKFSGDLAESVKQRQSDGSPFSVFETTKSVLDINAVANMPADRARPILEMLRDISSTVLELAATIHWLVNIERISDWRAELKRRKGSKTDYGRMEEAVMLLNRLGLTVAS